MTGRVEKVYSEALYELAAEDGSTGSLNDELKSLSDIFEANSELYSVLAAPTVAQSEKETILNNIFGGKISDTALNFLCLAARKGRIRALPGIAKAYREKWNEENNVTDVTVTSVKPLSKAQREKLIERLTAVYGKKVILTEKTDPSIMGGLKITCGDKQLDGTIRTKLDSIRSSMKNVIA